MKCIYFYWRNIIKHLFNVNTTSYNEKLFTTCCFQIGWFYIVYIHPAHVFSQGLQSNCTFPCIQWLSKVPGDSGNLSTYILLSNYGSAGMPPKSSITQRLWQSHIHKMRRPGFSPINTNLTIQSISILRKCFQLGKRFLFFFSQWN